MQRREQIYQQELSKQYKQIKKLEDQISKMKQSVIPAKTSLNNYLDNQHTTETFQGVQRSKSQFNQT